MNSILISVIVPAYNIEKYIGRCLDSLLCQTHKAIEIIVVNDGSSDDTLDIIEEYAKKDVRIVPVNKENGGVTSARLEGVKKATGEYIGFVDGDDEVEPEMFQHLLGNIIRYNADISHCGYQMVFPDGHVDYYYNTGRTVLQKGQEGTRDLVEGAFIEPGLCNKLFRKSLFSCLLENEIMDYSIKTKEDLLMNYYLFKQARLSVYEDMCPYHYVLRKGSAATSGINEYKLKDPMKVMDIIYNDTFMIPEVHSVAEIGITRGLIKGSALSGKINPELILPYRQEMRSRLRKKLPSILKNRNIGARLKVEAVWASIWPWSYGFVHNVYLKLTNLDKKYEI